MLSITVLHFQNNKLTNECCDSIDMQELPMEHEKVVVDNGSSSPFPRRKGWKVVRLKKNVGHIQGQNECFKAANYNFVLFVSNDVRLLQGCVTSLYYWHLHLGQVMPYIANENSKGLKYVWPGYAFTTKRNKWICPSIVYMMEKSTWHAVGGFDPYLGNSQEDVDMGLRLKKCGIRSKCVKDAVAIHLGNQTLKHTLKDHSLEFYKSRQRLIRKHYFGVDRWLRLSTMKGLFQVTKITRSIIR